jgi:hypothetical protein
MQIVSIPSKRINKHCMHAHHSDRSVAVAISSNRTYFADTPHTFIQNVNRLLADYMAPHLRGYLLKTNSLCRQSYIRKILYVWGDLRYGSICSLNYQKQNLGTSHDLHRHLVTVHSQKCFETHSIVLPTATALRIWNLIKLLDVFHPW